MRTMNGNVNKRQFYPYTIYTNQNHEYHAKNLIFYSIEQKGLFTDNGRRTPPPQSAPMGSRLASSLLSVNACGSSQGESRQDVIFRQKSADLRSESVSGSPW